MKSNLWRKAFNPGVVLGLAGVTTLLVAALVLAQTRVSPGKTAAALVSDLTPGIHAHDAIFPEERLRAYAGKQFDFRPELSEFLDTLEQQALPEDGGAPANVVEQLTRFVNREFVRFDEYPIHKHENYWIIAKTRGYTIDTIVGCNPHLEKIVCQVGQKILIPSRGGCLHQVKPGESLYQISLDYRVPADDILQANLVDPDWGLVPGMWLFIPGAKPLYLSEGMHKQYSKRALFRSPLSGRYTSFVGNRIHPVLGFSKYHNGVDIACKYRSWVGASAAGVVTVAGWGGAIGKYIKIDHQNGYMTMYGHLDTIYVHAGQKVKGGQLIARSGSTGRSTGPHLHYTIWENGVIKNPMDFLW
ncbi:MAG: LysM peptidoglycan-binding domain-containing M23 family metallopeptidase [Candidatus Firestonebacteria bacterium]|nr:LysM peptidoglycan-binding domain-containing M23 family metallopeptidase [Candidatus Firestonebacteria bacterium]